MPRVANELFPDTLVAGGLLITLRGMGSGRPVGRVLYRAIADALQERIMSGEWLPGQQMPTEPVLVAEFGVNRLTIRQALAQLQQTGVVDIRHGSGTFVANHPPVLEIALDGERVLDEGTVHATIKSITTDVTESFLGYTRDPNRVAASHIPE
jgi:DNA-binding transcriptional regulator YhcF (GntR family)